MNRLFESIVATEPRNKKGDSPNFGENVEKGAGLVHNRDEPRGYHGDRFIESEMMANYTVRIHSKPGGDMNYDDKNDDRTSEAHHQPDPWVITLDNFLTGDECDALIQLGHGNGWEQEGPSAGFQRSVDVGRLDTRDGTVYGRRSDLRTSETSWCTTGCRTAPVPQRIHQRISALLSIPSEHSEDIQILKYEKGQCT